MTPSQYASIGAIQGLCIPFRGFSRSGATISTGLFLRRTMPQPVRKVALNTRVTLGIIIGVCAAAISAGPQAHATDSARGASASLQRALTQLAREARPGTLGLAISDLTSGRSWRLDAERPFPMMSVFKAPLGVAVLSGIDKGTLSLGQRVIIRRADLVTSGLSRIAATFHGDQEAFTVRQLLAAAVSHSDNTAADVLLKLVGGGAVVTAFLRTHGVRGMRVDRGERQIAQESQAAYLKDPRDRTTPDAAALFLKKLWRGELLSPASTRILLGLLYEQIVPDRLRAGIPAGIRLADKCGTSSTVGGMTAAFNDMGILTWRDGHAVIVAAFLTASPASEQARNELFKAIARTVVADLPR